MIKPFPNINRRLLKDRLFKAFSAGLVLLILSLFLGLFAGICWKGLSSFFKAEIVLDLSFSKRYLKSTDPGQEQALNYNFILRKALQKELDVLPQTLEENRELMGLVSPTTDIALHSLFQKNPEILGTRRQISLRVSDNVDQTLKMKILDFEPANSLLTETQQEWLETLKDQDQIHQRFNTSFFTSSDSRDPMVAGIWAALIGSLYTLMVTLLISLPLGVGTALYLEEFASKNRWTNWIEINIANLAAVPSIIFGLLGLSIFLTVWGLPRSSPLVGGMTLALIMMPTVVVSTRSALKAIPKGIREGAFALGASKVQTTFHHVLPLALPGIITGAILGLARTLGESAPLLLVGMVAFVSQPPLTPMDAATVLPVQIFTWARNPERGFIENTAGAIFVLILILIGISMIAKILRQRFERKW